MKKIFQMILLIILFLTIFSEQCDKFTGIPTQVNDCLNQLSDEQKNTLKKTHCCLFQSDDQVNPRCISLTEKQYENINDYIEDNEILWGHIHIKIDCSSFNINLRIIYAILFIFILFG